jgi:hypothetical protein
MLLQFLPDVRADSLVEVLIQLVEEVLTGKQIRRPPFA